ncbi:FG-GAP repeat protein [Patiriisocius sp. Uisw_017]|jgi:hypothetical protein|uniref:FG-GAP repeat protein n=1 Tax=Patiriisocius sp. Uisw_017 TaxID=3230968 RepID=UPI0039ED911F
MMIKQQHKHCIVLFGLLLRCPLLNISQTQLGRDIDGEAADDFSGESVSLSADGTIMAVGANRNDGNGTNSGHVRISGYDGDNWNQGF